MYSSTQFIVPLYHLRTRMSTVNLHLNEINFAHKKAVSGEY